MIGEYQKLWETLIELDFLLYPERTYPSLKYPTDENIHIFFNHFDIHPETERIYF